MSDTEYKGYRVTPLGTFAMYKIQPRGSGDIPKVLEGNYTSLRDAHMAIDRHLASLLGRGRKKNGSEASTSTS